MKYFVISDIHGCLETFKRLVGRRPKGHEVMVLGDLVDRGPDSRGVIDFIRKRGYRTVKGNHDHMMHMFLVGNPLSCYGATTWDSNGSLQTFWSYRRDNQTRKDQEMLTMVKDARWLEALPTFIEENGILFSHTGHGKMQDDFDAVWSRLTIFPDDGLFRVFGHTPAKEPILTARYAMVDTGCAYRSNGFGRLTGMVLDSSRPHESTFIHEAFSEPATPKDKDL